MADSIISSAADRLKALIAYQTRYNVNLVFGAEKSVHDLAEDLQNIRIVLDNADNFQFRGKNINRWLAKLEQLTYEIDNILEEWNYAIRKLQIAAVSPPKQKVYSFIPSSWRLFFKKIVESHDIAKKIINVKAQFDGILRERDQYDFDISQPTFTEFWRVQSTPFVDLAAINGRDTDRDILVSKLVDKGGSSQEEFGIQVVSIVGMVGLGKTTLAQLVYNHSRVDEYFDLKVWICVSDPFDLRGIAKGILGCIGNFPKANNLDVLLREVHESICGKRFILVLDDVWTKDYSKWIALISTLSSGGAGSSVLVTTRNVRFAKMVSSRDSEIYRLGLLSEEDCKLLLCRVALSEGNQVEFEEISQKIARKCNGLPLAAKTLGNLLSNKTSLKEWENILEGEIGQMEEAEVHIFPHLLLSYNEMSPTLKRCFSYCAVFPKNTKINIENLIENWMTLGYLGSDVGNMELRGRYYFNDLAMHCLFQDFEKDGNDVIQSCKMHDIVHDFAQFLKKNVRAEAAHMNKSTTCRTCDPLQVFIANVFHTLYCDEETPPNFCECLIRLRVLSLANCGLRSIPQGMEHWIHLRNLNLAGFSRISHEDLKIIFRLDDLQTLSLSKCSLEVIPREIGDLIHLGRLDLSWNECLKELPEEIGDLVQLRKLNLNQNTSLKELPEIKKLIFLRHLNLIGNTSLEELPKSIHDLQELETLNILGCKRICRLPEAVAELTGLRTLGEFRAGKGCNKFGLLKNLNNLGGVLWLRITLDGDLAEMVDDARAAELSNKTHIDEFRMYFEESESESSSVSLNVIDVLQPHSNLKKLSIWNYGGSRLPTWLLSSQVRNLNLHFCKHLTSLPTLGKLPFLEELCIDLMEALSTVGREFLGGDVIAFPKLKTLEFRDCGEWKEWEDITVEEEESAASWVMPCLTELTITCCSGLTVLPHRLLRKASSLAKLCITGSTELVQLYENKDGSDWKSISRNNCRLQLISYT